MRQVKCVRARANSERTELIGPMALIASAHNGDEFVHQIQKSQNQSLVMEYYWHINGWLVVNLYD